MPLSATPSNTAYTPTSPGQEFPATRVQAAPFITSSKYIAAGGLAMGGNIPTIAILSGAGTVGSITNVSGYDQACTFNLLAGTASIFGGSLVSVTFGQPLAASPIAVVVDAAYPSGTVSFGCGAVSISKTGFVIAGGAPNSGQTVTVSYFVVRSPFS